MTNEVKVALTNAVYKVYEQTMSHYSSKSASTVVEFSVNDGLMVTKKMVTIARYNTEKENLYKMYIANDKAPFITVFGCWPIGFVTDIFIKALEHYYEWY